MNSDAPGTSLLLSISFLLLVAVLFYLKVRHLWKKMLMIIPVFTIIGVIGLSVSGYYTGKEYRELKKVILNNEHSVIEGPVADFISQSDTGLIPESFTVDGVSFSYYDNKSSSAFHESSINGGPLKDGLKVRIFYYEKKIIGLWIKE